MTPDDLAALTDAVLRVGDGRGFLVEWRHRRFVITAAHCLPYLPGTSHPAAYLEEHTYANLLGPLGAVPAVWAELLFLDFVSDVAVLGTPDTQELSEHADAFDHLVDDRPVIRAATVPAESPGWILTLDDGWIACTVRTNAYWRGRVSIDGAKVVGGMSGSPILLHDGRAAGVVSCTDFHPRLDTDLPGWLLTALGIR